MPLIGKPVTLAAGATSTNQFADTTYQTVSPGTRLVVSCAAQDSTGALKNGTDPEVTYSFRVNAVDLATNVAVPILTDGTVIAGQNGAYQMNSFTTTAASNRPFLQFTNNSAATRIITNYVSIQFTGAAVGAT